MHKESVVKPINQSVINPLYGDCDGQMVYVIDHYKLSVKVVTTVPDHPIEHTCICHRKLNTKDYDKLKQLGQKHRKLKT